jgi:TolB-like protein
MLRSMSYATKGALTLAAAAALALPGAVRAQDNRPVVVVFTFTNSALGPARAEFDGISTGVQDLLITDMASNSKIRLVDRARIAELMQEQNLVKGGQIDPATAIRLGKMMGAQYAVTGGYISDSKGKAILTGRTIDMETSQIANPEKIEGKSDDVLGLISQLSSKLASGMNLAPKPGRRVGDAGDAAKSAPVQSGSPAAPAAASKATDAGTELFAKVIKEPLKTRLDGPTLKLYSQALDEMDKNNKAKAKELLNQVLAKYSDFQPAKAQLQKIS